VTLREVEQRVTGLPSPRHGSVRLREVDNALAHVNRCFMPCATEAFGENRGWRGPKLRQRTADRLLKRRGTADVEHTRVTWKLDFASEWAAGVRRSQNFNIAFSRYAP